MIPFSTLLVKFFLFSTAYNYVLSNSENMSFNDSDRSSLTSNGYELSNFLFTLSNSSSIGSRINTESSNQVDCLGLGKTVATTLEWFFMSNPNGSNALNVQFLLSSRRQRERVQVVIGEQFGLEWTDFQPRKRTIIIVHGFLSHSQESWVNDMEKSFLRWGDVNVVIVDWSAGGNTWNYYKAAVNTKVVGYQIARFLEQVENSTIAQDPTNYDSLGPLYLIGHSLGAHICGVAAKELKKRHSTWRVERITGLDPAQPCFKNADASVKLHKSDAAFVDIIHTNGRLLSEIGLGLPDPIGHVDFYPNGGRSQPGCVKIESSYFTFLPIPIGAVEKSICSHGRSYVYLTESLITDVQQNCTFWAHHWDLSFRNLNRIALESCNRNVCSEMGINAIHYPQRGTFFAVTSDSVPFCVNSTRIIDEAITQIKADHADELDD